MKIPRKYSWRCILDHGHAGDCVPIRTRGSIFDGECMKTVEKPKEHAQANAGLDVPDRCRYCGYPFMDHTNGKCPEPKPEDYE